MARIEISEDKQLQPGDIVELDFQVSSWLWLQSTEISLIESHCSKRKDWEIISNTLPADNVITFKILIKDTKRDEPELQRAGLGVTCAYIATVIVAAGMVALLFVGSYQIKDSAAGKLALTGAGSAGIAFLLYMLYKWLKE